MPRRLTSPPAWEASLTKPPRHRVGQEGEERSAARAGVRVIAAAPLSLVFLSGASFGLIKPIGIA